MDTAVLVKPERDAGWELLDNLEAVQFPLQAAFWQYLPDAEEWRLFLVTPLLEKEDGNKVYSRLQEYINQMSEEIQEEFSVMNISLLSPRSERLVQLKKRYGKVEKNRSRIRRTHLSADDSYVYFL